jgi:hypothetical protein
VVIKEIASKREHENSLCKLKIDLKKYNPSGMFGDINCFGFENSIKY